MYSRPLPSEKKSEKGVCGAGGDCAQASLRRIIHSSSSSKTANNKIPVSSCFNDSEGLYRKTVFRCLVHRPHYSARLMRLGSRGPREFFFSDTPPKCLHRDCVGRRRTGTRYGDVYLIVREKQGIVVETLSSNKVLRRSKQSAPLSACPFPYSKFGCLLLLSNSGGTTLLEGGGKSYICRSFEVAKGQKGPLGQSVFTKFVSDFRT